MCGGARYVDSNGKDWKVYFPSPKAALPVVRPDGVEWIKWGRRKEETASRFVQGGWARHDSIEAGKWARCKPEIVQLAVIAFMEKDAERVSHWIDVPEGMAIEGLIVTQDDDARLYVVTEDTPTEYAWVHDRWPRITRRDYGKELGV